MNIDAFIFEARLLKSFKAKKDSKQKTLNILLTSTNPKAIKVVEKVRAQIVGLEKAMQLLEEKLKNNEPKPIQMLYEAYISSTHSEEDIKLGLYATEEKARKAIELSLQYLQITTSMTNEEMCRFGTQIKEIAVE